MSAKIFIKGDYRHFIINNLNTTDYKVFYDNQYNNIQTKDDVVKSLGKNEKYVDNYIVKVFNNGIWIDLALLENYFNENEVRKSVFYRILTENGFEIISTGGTKQVLDEAGIETIGIEDVTHFPEILDGRVKTLNPYVHGGLLARRDLPEHMATLEKLNITPIDLVCVNLYPFKETIEKPGVI